MIPWTASENSASWSSSPGFKCLGFCEVSSTEWFVETFSRGSSPCLSFKSCRFGQHKDEALMFHFAKCRWMLHIWAIHTTQWQPVLLEKSRCVHTEVPEYRLSSDKTAILKSPLAAKSMTVKWADCRLSNASKCTNKTSWRRNGKSGSSSSPSAGPITRGCRWAYFCPMLFSRASLACAARWLSTLKCYLFVLWDPDFSLVRKWSNA